MEDALSEIKDYFDDNFVTKLTEIRTARSDTDTEDPALINNGPSQSKEYPKIEILPGDTTHDYGFDDAPLLRPWLFHGVDIRITHSYPQITIVKNTLLRYAETVNKLQEDDDTFGEKFTWVQITAEDYSPMIENIETRELIQMVVMTLSCRTLG
jgi:hypothetical protein